MSYRSIAPVSPSDRIESLDVLRGFAVLGILWMNSITFAQPFMTYINPTLWGDFNGINYAVWFIRHVFFNQKMMTIFTMLFGAGIVLMTGRIEAAGRSSFGVHYRRNFVLLVFGLLHIGILWYGDVLLQYALCAVIVYWFRRIRPSILLVLGVLIFALSPLHTLAIHWNLPALSLDEQTQFLKTNWLTDRRDLLGEINIFQGGWYDQTFVRLLYGYWVQVQYNLIGLEVLRTIGMMLVGMALFKWDVLSARRSIRFYVGLIGLGIAGLSIVLYGVYRIEANEWSGIYYFSRGVQYNLWGAPLAALGWIGLVMLACKSDVLAWIKRPLANAGQMALTCYILQTVFCCFIFYGYGLGLIGQLDRWQQMLVVLAIWTALLVFSTLWLRFIRFGPLEWIWRCVTYLSLQPLWRERAEKQNY